MNRTLHIRLTPRTGQPQVFTVEGQSLRVGTAAHCEVRLPHGTAAAEHVVIDDAGPAGLRVEALAKDPEPTLDGKPFSRALLEPGATLEIGGTKLAVTVPIVAATAAGKPKGKSNPLVYVAAAVIAPFALFDLSPAEDPGLSPPREAPALFAVAPTSCPQTEPDSAAAFGHEQRELADAKAERRPFHARDGVRAVALYRLAAACLRAGGEAPAADRAEAAAGRMKRDIEESYRTRRVRLEHALSTENRAVARHEITALLDLTNGLSGEYVTWLSNLDRRLRLVDGQGR